MLLTYLIGAGLITWILTDDKKNVKINNDTDIIGLNGTAACMLSSQLEEENREINVNNYFIRTYGKFDNLSKGLSNFLYKKAIEINVGDEVYYMGKKYVFNYKSQSSFYYTDEYEQILYRISDHWSEDIGWIRSCWWSLKKEKELMFQGGKIKFTDFKNTYKHINSLYELKKIFKKNKYDPVSFEFKPVICSTNPKSKYNKILFISNNKFKFYYKYVIKADIYIDEIYNEIVKSIAKRKKRPNLAVITYNKILLRYILNNKNVEKIFKLPFYTGMYKNIINEKALESKKNFTEWLLNKYN